MWFERALNTCKQQDSRQKMRQSIITNYPDPPVSCLRLVHHGEESQNSACAGKKRT